MPNPKSRTTQKKKSSAQEKSSKQISPIFHAVLFSYETTLMKSCFGKNASIIPELSDNLEMILPDYLVRRAEKTKSIVESGNLLSDYLTSSNQFGSIEFADEGKNIFSINVIDCSFAKNGIHKHIRTGNNVCPIALVYAAFVSRTNGNQNYATVTPSFFEERSSFTRMSVKKLEDGRSISSFGIAAGIGDYPMDETDAEILKIMQKNARLTNVEIADALDTSEATVRRHIQNLMDNGIIKGFVAKIDHGRFKRKVRVHFALDVKLDKIDDIAKRLLARPELCSLYKSLGPFNLICELLMNDMESVQSFIDEISRTDGVIKTNSMIATSSLKPCPWYD